MERKKIVFYGSAILVALLLVAKIQIFESPPPSSPPEIRISENDDLLGRALPSLEYIRTHQPEGISDLHSVSVYSHNDSLKLDYCYSDTLITKLISPTFVPSVQIRQTGHHYQTFLATIPEDEDSFFNIEYPELWVPTTIYVVFLLILLSVRGVCLTAGIVRRKWVYTDKSKPQPLPCRWGKGQWIQITDTGVYICISVFIMTGLLSMSPIPKWLGDSHWKKEESKIHPPLRLEGFSLDPGKLLQPDAYGISATGGEKVCMLKLRSYLDRPLVEIIRQTNDGLIQPEYIYAAKSTPRRFIVTRPDILHSLEKLYGTPIPLVRMSLLEEYDEYYHPGSDLKRLPLPVYKVEIDNKVQDLYYFPSSTPTYYHYNSNTKLRKKISSLPDKW
ncbi:hypothetical protein [Parabacteroides timonensis]|uniref:hypothetical protein n=1 Tax=Parabacteroides timonensis TaxID=1871013 RepID=UPI001F2DEC38|nr:hypothetical protein [Parabacteroides timonensis]